MLKNFLLSSLQKQILLILTVLLYFRNKGDIFISKSGMIYRCINLVK
jgi:hypothetical protein